MGNLDRANLLRAARQPWLFAYGQFSRRGSGAPFTCQPPGPKTPAACPPAEPPGRRARGMQFDDYQSERAIELETLCPNEPVGKCAILRGSVRGSIRGFFRQGPGVGRHTDEFGRASQLRKV